METKATKLLLVDDEEGITELFEEMLEAVGYDCSTAASGEEALEIISEGPVDLALVDIMMPGMSGLTLFQQARALHPDLAVIFVTAVRDIHTAVENLVNGAYNYLVKPVTRKQLLLAVEQTLSKRSALLEERQVRGLLEERVALQTRELEARAREFSFLNGGSRPSTPVHADDVVDETPLENLNLSRRVTNCLKRAHIRKVCEVLEMSNGDLLRVRNFGKKHLEELQVALQSQQRPGGAQHADFGSGARGLVAYEAVGS